MRIDRVIEMLRAKYPGRWRYDSSDPVWPWKHEEGWCVGARSQLTGRDDEECYTTYYRQDPSGGPAIREFLWP